MSAGQSISGGGSGSSSSGGSTGTPRFEVRPLRFRYGAIAKSDFGPDLPSAVPPGDQELSLEWVGKRIVRLPRVPICSEPAVRGSGTMTLHMLRSLHILMMSLGILGFLLQTFAKGAGAGQALCVGCETSWWTVRLPCDAANGIDCCEVEEETGDASAFRVNQPSAHGQNECGCIDVPLHGHATVAVATARIDPAGEPATHPPAPVLGLSRSLDVPTTIMSWARAGPRSSPRQLAPRSRCTVLVI